MSSTDTGPGRVAGADADELTAPLLDPTFYAGDPFPLYARLRAEAPLAHSEAGGFWVASRHEEVVAISRDPEAFCSGRGILTMEIGAEYPTPPTMMHTDPPDHDRYRQLVQPGFRPTFMRALEDGIRERTVTLVDRIEPGVPVDVVPGLAVPLPLQVISDLLGVPEEEWPRFFRWSEAVIPGATDWSEEERAELSGEMVTYLLAAAADRRAHPRDDIISELGAAEVDGDRLTDAELGMFLVQLLVAGNETTRNMMSGGLLGVAGAGGAVGVAARTDFLARAPRAAAPGRRGDAPVDHAGGGVHAHHYPVGGAGRAPLGRRRAGPDALRLGEPRRGGVRPHRRAVRRRPATPIPMWPSASAPTSVSGRSWPVSRVASCWRS